MDTHHQFTWVDSDAGLISMVTQLSNERLIAVDTEFIRTDTYYPKVGLIQIASPTTIYLVDPLPLSSVEPLREVFYGEHLEALIFHSCSEDLEVFKTLWQEVPSKIFDTQVAAALLNLERQPSLQKLLLLLLEVDLPKGETRSNWLQRPLTESQMRYAVLDVAYLIQVYHILSQKLVAVGRQGWVEEDCQGLADKYSASIDFDNLYRSVGNAWKLRPKQLALLQRLTAWRDRTAMEKNRPKGHVLKDATIFELAERMPVDKKGLASCELLSVGQAKRFGSVLVDFVKEVNALDSSKYPEVLDRPFSRSHKALAKKMKDVVEKKANNLDIPMERLASRKLLERYAKAMLHNKPIPNELTGWRHEILVSELNAVFIEHRDSSDF